MAGACGREKDSGSNEGNIVAVLMLWCGWGPAMLVDLSDGRLQEGTVVKRWYGVDRWIQDVDLEREGERFGNPVSRLSGLDVRKLWLIAYTSAAVGRSTLYTIPKPR